MIDELKWQHLERAVVEKSDAGPKIHILKPPNSLDCCKLAARLRKSKIFSVINPAACKTVDHWLIRH
jgi:hypothetical protein